MTTEKIVKNFQLKRKKTLEIRFKLAEDFNIA